MFKKPEVKDEETAAANCCKPGYVTGFASPNTWTYPLFEPQASIEPQTEAESANDRQVGGDHYKNMKIQPWDVIDSLTHAHAIGFYRGNALKYIMRAGEKGPAKEDYEKAVHYLQKLIETL